MSNFLKRDNRIRYKNSTGELVLYNPTKEQYDTLIEEMKSSVKINEEQQFEGVSSLTFLRYIYENLTSLKDELKDLSNEDFEKILTDKLEGVNRDYEIVKLHRAIGDLCNELAEDVQYQVIEQIRTLNNIVELTKIQKSSTMAKHKFDKLKEEVEKKNKK